MTTHEKGIKCNFLAPLIRSSYANLLSKLVSIFLPLTKKVITSFRQKKIIEVNQKWKNRISV